MEISTNKTTARVGHGFGPVYDARSRVLILGSFPSVKSREQGFYYGHPRNRFWPVLAAVLKEPEVPQSVGARRAFALRHGIALWDVIESCEIRGSSDSSIRNVEPTELSRIFDAADIRAVYVNGATASRYYEKYQLPICGRTAVRLPSTSPANAAWSLERLVEAWRVIAPGD